MPTKMAGSSSSCSTSPPSSESGSNSTRLLRNLAEKQRRDKLNGFISELATIVPMVSMASKRLDKTSILRLSAAHLRICQSPLSRKNKRTRRSFKWCPDFLSSEQVQEILEAVDGFLMVTTPSGKIMYISHTVENFIGHQHIEMIGHSLFSFIHPSDVEVVQAEMENLSFNLEAKNGSTRPTSRCSFYCRMRERSQPRSEILTYQFVHVVGHMAPVPDEKDEDADSEESNSKTSTNQILKAFVRVVKSNPYNELSLADAIEDEYVTRHGLDGTIIFADHRISTITGHLPHEVCGSSAYNYIIQDDIPVALFAHQLMFSSNKGTGIVVYRLRTRDEGFVYLKSTGYLQFEKSTTQVDHFVCVNKQLSNSEGDEELKSFVDRFTPHINGNSAATLFESIKAVHVSGLKVPLKNDTKSCPKLDPACTEQCLKKPNTIKDEPHQSVPDQNLTAPPPSNDPSSREPKDYCYKVLLEENHAEVSSNHSPMTESSLSANSPHSNDSIMLSPSAFGGAKLDDLPSGESKMDCSDSNGDGISTLLASSVLLMSNGGSTSLSEWSASPGASECLSSSDGKSMLVCSEDGLSMNSSDKQSDSC